MLKILPFITLTLISFGYSYEDTQIVWNIEYLKDNQKISIKDKSLHIQFDVIEYYLESYDEETRTVHLTPARIMDDK